MRLYHFLNEQYGIENISKRRLKIARIDELNDPFEFASVHFGNEALRRAFSVMKAELNQTRGLLCFSTKWTNPVQWSHYADRHRGLCLGFDIPDEKVGSVSYSRKRVVVELERLKNPRELGADSAQQLLFTKYHHWRYENEFRAFVTLEDVDQESRLYFADFSDNLALKEVIVGARSNVTRAQLASALGSLAGSVVALKARLAFGSFSVVRQRKGELWG